MRIIWKDSNSKKSYQPVKYRGYIATGSASGWTVNIPGDVNLYKNHYCALNAIDEYLGDSQMGSLKRRSCGIEIIGLKK